MTWNTFRKINDNLRVIIQGKSSTKTSDFLQAFLVDMFPIEAVENLHEEEFEFGVGHGWDELTISINPQRNIPEEYSRIIIERRIKLFTSEDEYQVWVELEFDKMAYSESFYKKSDFFSEKAEWINVINSNNVFKKLKDSIPIKIIRGDNFDFVG
ncbi:hypothetical protein SAMN05428975_5834 [Mucilaginibacter sp. OK268]|uniref:hypothetical protein n=1 Tax=Mucilaginibacter sp. OK268 TaxID=1881048 RepID=UPI000881B212|nr:hypothetical protein [Mucilaginibacter sp. OK268]SDQ01490.1 hypothetical protein SAMN05428975_5834 [Mucilaginibacter sp. OK268]